MKTTIDRAGRVVIPKELRRAAGLQPGTVLDIRLQDGRIEIEAAPAPIKLVRQGMFLVAVSDTPREALTADEVEAVRDSLQRERMSEY